MKKGIRILCSVLVLCVVFLLGWRVMPKVWPGFKNNVVCKVIPTLCEEEETTAPMLYTPKSNSKHGDEITKSDSLIYYFYKDTCPHCVEIAPLMDGLPEWITLPDGTKSNVKLICLNKAEDEYLQLIHSYYDVHEIPEDQWLVPSVVIGDRYLFLEDEISEQLLDALMAGEGLETEMIDGEARG